VWVNLMNADRIARFDPKTEKFTFFPYPQPDDHNAKISVDQRGILWMGTGRPSQLTMFRPKGNVPSRSPAL
jgi:streptogramin lyase